MDKTGVMTLNPILLAIKEEPTNPIPPGAIIIDNPSPYFWQINLKENKKNIFEAARSIDFFASRNCPALVFQTKSKQRKLPSGLPSVSPLFVFSW